MHWIWNPAVWLAIAFPTSEDSQFLQAGVQLHVHVSEGLQARPVLYVSANTTESTVKPGFHQGNQPETASPPRLGSAVKGLESIFIESVITVTALLLLSDSLAATRQRLKFNLREGRNRRRPISGATFAISRHQKVNALYAGGGGFASDLLVWK